MESKYGYYDPDGDVDWFPPNPLDSMPIATYSDQPSWEDTAPSEYEPPDDWFNDKPEPKEETIHEKMYQMAIQKHSPWKGGGSENFQGGSENLLNSN